MTNEEFLLKMQSWQRRLLREGNPLRVSITLFEDNEVMASAWDGRNFCTEMAYPPGDVLEHYNEENARNIDKFITDKIK